MAADPASAWIDAIDTLSHEEVSSGRCAGIAAAVIASGQVRSARAYGLANIETQTPVAPDSVFRIGSITKTFTAAAILLLRDEKHLRLTDPLSSFFPQIPGSDRLTLQQLLSHTSGIHDYVWGGLPPGESTEWTTSTDFVDRVKRMTPLSDFEPGTLYSYSNTGYILLGAIIEKVTGQGYGTFLSTHLLAPAGAPGIAVDSNHDVVQNRVSGYVLADGKPGSFRHAPHIDALPFSAGALRSTVPELAKWQAALFQGKILRPTSVKEMTAVARVKSGQPVGSARWLRPGGNLTPPPSHVTANDYGLGLRLRTAYGVRSVGHDGSIGGFSSQMLYFPDKDIGFVLLTNTEKAMLPIWRGLESLVGLKRL
jgi:CubicO group peptidase (beta-lactamase class C family)